MPLPYKVGSSDQNTNGEITTWGKWFKAKYSSYAAPVDGYYGLAERDAVSELQRRLGIPVTGVFDEVTAVKSGYKPSKPAAPRRKIWFYSAPGSGAPWHVGPSFETGEWCKNVLNLNHQPVGYPIGGYMGLMGGDPSFSYIDVINALAAELERLLAENPDIRDPELELWFSGYSQSADGMLEAVNKLFGDGGRFAHLRSRINGVIVFGNPATAGTGIARKTFPAWLNALTRNINTKNDFYAVATDKIRPLFYEWFIEAETELPFVVYSSQIILPAIANLIPVVGPILGPLFPLALAMQTGVNSLLPMLTTITGGVNSATKKPNPELIELLSMKGLLTSLPDLMGLITALPGLQSHGEYHLPKPEFNGRTGIQVACDTVAAFRR